MTQRKKENVKKRETTYIVEPYSQGFKDWLLNRTTLGTFFNYDLNKEYPPQYHSLENVINNFVTGFKYTLTRLFPFDGYDPISQQITYHNNKKGPVYKDHQFGWLTLLAFFGLPTRPHAVKAKDGTLNPELTFTDVVVNLFGGWKSPWLSLTREQLIVQLIAFFTVKPFVIFPLNVVTGLFKFFVNIVKLAIFIPLHIVGSILHEIFRFLLTSTHKAAFSDWRPILKIPATIFLGLLSLTSLLEIPLIICDRIMKAILTPLVSFRNHLAIGRRVKLLSDRLRKFNAEALENYDPKVPPADPIADTIGYTSALVSFAITAIAWAFILSLAIGAITTFFPALIPAVVATFGWVAQLPFIAGAFGVLQSAIGLSLIPSIIGSLIPFISTLSAFLGLHVSLTLLTSAATVGFSAALIGVPLTYAANKFSNWYVSWYGTQSATRVLIQKKSAGAHDFDPESDDEDDSADIELANKKLLEARSTEQQASVEGRKDSTSKGASAPRDDAQHLVKKVNLSRAQTDHREQQATAKGSAVETSSRTTSVPANSSPRDPAPTDNNTLAFLQQTIGENFQLGKARPGADSFYASFAHGLNQLQQTEEHSIKTLRNQCATTVRQFKGNSADHSWFKAQFNNQVDLAAYNMAVELTADEFQNNDMGLQGQPISGDQNIDGVILCKKYGVNLHIIEICEKEVDVEDFDEENDISSEEEMSTTVSHHLITPEGKSKTITLDEIPDTDTISIVKYNQHFVPVIPVQHDLGIDNSKRH